MLILGIESSCDDTSVALVKADKSGFEILSEKTASQIEVHKKYGGVVPEIAGRKHAEKILPLIESAFKNHDEPDVIAVTCGPGLMTGLLVGMEAAKTLSYLWDVPLVRINHIEGHLYSILIQNKIMSDNGTMGQSNNARASIDPLTHCSIVYPALCLIVSGGHTEIILIKKQGKYELIGKTRDDAAGECFDKVAKLVGFDYPGGPMISKYAENGDPNAIPFPRPMIDDESFDFSFSGLKTAALYWLQDNAKKRDTGYGIRDTGLNDFCASFEQAIVDVLVAKTIRAAKKYKSKTIILGGGVSANKKLRETLKQAINKTPLNSELRTPNLKYSMDNAVMIAVAGYYHAQKKDFTSWDKLEADPNWKLATK